MFKANHKQEDVHTLDFYTENINTIFKQLNFFLKFCYRQEATSLSTIKEVVMLRTLGELLDQADFQIGVSSRVLMEKVVEIKTEEQINQLVKKLSALELQIKEMEKYEDRLSHNERMRLASMRERQMMVEMLNFNEEKEAMKGKRLVSPREE